MEVDIEIKNEIKQAFEQVKEIEWKDATVSFYIVKRSLTNKKAKYTTLLVNSDRGVKFKLKSIACKKLENSNEAIDYDFNTSDLDNNVLGIKTEETDLKSIIDDINSSNFTIADKLEALLPAWIYIARLDIKGKSPLYSVRRISENWKTKKVSQPFTNLIYSNNMLVDIKKDNILRIDNQVDFFSHNGTIFIANKKNFEAALNFREGMERNRDEIVKEFQKLNLFVNADEIKRIVGDNIPRLRKLSQVKKSGYYLEQNYLTSLKQVAQEDNWDIAYSNDGRLIVTEDNIDSVLLVLNNGRLTSKINHESFDVDVKHKYSPKRN